MVHPSRNDQEADGEEVHCSLELGTKARAVTLSLGVPRHASAIFHPWEPKLQKGIPVRKEDSECKAED